MLIAIGREVRNLLSRDVFDLFSHCTLKAVTVLECCKVTAGFYSGHFYSSALAATAVITLGVGYAATRGKIVPPRSELGSMAS